MHKTAKILIAVLALVLIAFVAYRATKSRTVVGTPSPDKVTWTSFADPQERYALDQPQGFDPLPSVDGSKMSFRNAALTREGQPATVSVELMDNPDDLDLQSWFDQQIRDGILPAYSTSTKITRDGRLGGKEVITVRPAVGSSSYFFVAGPKKIAVMHEILAEAYMDRFIRSFSLK